MKKKIIFGSVIAVAILIGVSFTSVVGYRSGPSDVKASPLFNIRSSRAIDEESEELWCEYVGKGDTINLLIPDKNGNEELFQKIFNMISKMDDETYNKFANSLVLRIKQNDDFKNVNTDKLVSFLNLFRKNQEDILIQYQINNVNHYCIKDNRITSWENQFCYLLFILIQLIISIPIFILFYIQLLFTIVFDCMDSLMCYTIDCY